MWGVFAGVADVFAEIFVPIKARLNDQHKDGVQSHLHWY
jgi:hypothetical protein